MKELEKLRLSEFISETASKSAVPGGGGVSALAGSLGIALGAMVGRLTCGKKKYADVEEDMKKLIEESDRLRDELLSCVNEDAEGFEPLSEIYSLPKDAEGRDEKLEEALRNAAKTPLKIMELSCRAIELLKKFGEKGSILAISDAAAGAMMCRAALFGGAINVIANTGLMKDKEYADELDTKASEMVEKYSEMADLIYADVWEKLP